MSNNIIHCYCFTIYTSSSFSVLLDNFGTVSAWRTVLLINKYLSGLCLSISLSLSLDLELISTFLKVLEVFSTLHNIKGVLWSFYLAHRCSAIPLFSSTQEIPHKQSFMSYKLSSLTRVPRVAVNWCHSD